jgi:hypothetical protein
VDKRLEAREILRLIVYGEDFDPDFMTSATERSRVDVIKWFWKRVA